MRPTRALALLVVGLLLLPGLAAAAHGCLTGGNGGCGRPQPVSHGCCPPPAASLLASCCSAGEPGAPTTPTPTAERPVPLAVASALGVPAVQPPTAATALAPPQPLSGRGLATTHAVLRR